MLFQTSVSVPYHMESIFLYCMSVSSVSYINISTAILCILKVICTINNKRLKTGKGVGLNRNKRDNTNILFQKILL